MLGETGSTQGHWGAPWIPRGLGLFWLSEDVGVAHILDPNTGLGINWAIMAWQLVLNAVGGRFRWPAMDIHIASKDWEIWELQRKSWPNEKAGTSEIDTM